MLPPNAAAAADYPAAAARILARCDALAAFSEEPDCITRTFLSPPMRDVHHAVQEWMEDAGLAVRVDAVGNIVGESGVAASERPVLLIGSHLDTVRNAGRYDGILGVLLGIEAAAIVRDSGVELPFDLHAVGFSEEEGVRFPPYLGSQTVAGTLDLALLDDLRDANGMTLRQAISDFGLDPARVPEAAYPPGRLLAYVEAHIEQGPRLEDAQKPVAAVEAIAGQSRLLLRVTGSAGHAGNCPMPLRRDALTGAASIILEIEAMARATGGLTATVGFIENAPNISNIIPAEVTLSADIRHKSDDVRRAAVARLKQFGAEMAQGRGLRFAVERERGFDAVPMDARLISQMRDAVSEVTGDAEPPVLTSGAGHDAAMLAVAAPAVMLFVRGLNGGISHHPDEAVLLDDVSAALQVLVHFIYRLTNPVSA